MMTDRTRQRGFLLTELIVGMILLGMAVMGLTVSLRGYAMINHYQWTRQRCVAAAEAQLDSLAATGKSIDPNEIERLWPKVTVSVARTAGRDVWDGLDLVRVTAVGKAGRHAVSIRLERYLPKDHR